MEREMEREREYFLPEKMMSNEFRAGVLAGKNGDIIMHSCNLKR